MSDILIGNAYTPAEAERGKFAVIDPSTLSAMGLTGSYGRYAILTYAVGSNITASLPNTTSETVLTLTAASISAINFNPAVSLLEISNNTNDNVFLTYNPAITDFATLSANGLTIAKGAFYSIDRTTTAVTIGSTAGGSIVVFGHYKV